METKAHAELGIGLKANPIASLALAHNSGKPAYSERAMIPIHCAANMDCRNPHPRVRGKLAATILLPALMLSIGGTLRGAGTNAITVFTVVKNHNYVQTSAGAPTFEFFGPYAFPYVFVGGLQLVSNRTASAVTLALPSGGVSNLVNSAGHPESYAFGTAWSSTTLAGFDAKFPAGNYVFNVTSASSNQQKTLTLTSAMQQPNAPHVTNFTAVQAVNPAQAFTLAWDPFIGAAGSDYISVTVGSNLFSKKIAGTALSTQLPAGTFQPSSQYTVTLGFYRSVFTTNGVDYTEASRCTTTKLTLVTTAGTVSPQPPVLRNPNWSQGSFSFDILTTPGPITVFYSTNLLTPSWKTLLVTNASGTLLRIVDPLAKTNLIRFYRVQSGS